jgi:dienelactone hydrolase
VTKLSRRSFLAAAAGTAALPAAAAAQHAHDSDPRVRELPGFVGEDFKADGHTRRVFVQGQGAPVLLLHELPGLSWPAILLAQRLVDLGFRVHMPLLFGGAGQRSGFKGYFQSCFGSQFDCSDPAGTSRILEWLRELTKEIARREQDRRMAAIGMCLTGAFPLALMDIPAVTAGVLSQPSLPLKTGTPEQRRGLGLSAAEVDRARNRRDAKFLALRFSKDKLCPPEKFETLAAALGDRLEPIVIPSGDGTQFPDDAHAVLSGWYRSTPGHPTRLAFERLVAFLKEVL